jgi:hypothetical protein
MVKPYSGKYGLTKEETELVEEAGLRIGKVELDKNGFIPID